MLGMIGNLMAPKGPRRVAGGERSEPPDQDRLEQSSDRSEGEATNHAMALMPVTIACAPVGAWYFLDLVRGLPRVAPGYLPAGLRPSRTPNNLKCLNGYNDSIE